jgi:hypothetical protein
MNYRELPKDKAAMQETSYHEAAKSQNDEGENKLS